MTTMTIQIENPSIIASLKKVLSAMEGVSIMKSARVRDVSTPNTTTIKAIKEVKAGKTHKASSVDDLIAQCLQ